MDLVFRNYCAMKVDSDVKSITTIQNSVALNKVVGVNFIEEVGQSEASKIPATEYDLSVLYTSRVRYWWSFHKAARGTTSFGYI